MKIIVDSKNIILIPESKKDEKAIKKAKEDIQNDDTDFTYRLPQTKLWKGGLIITTK